MVIGLDYSIFSILQLTGTQEKTNFRLKQPIVYVNKTKVNIGLGPYFQSMIYLCTNYCVAMYAQILLQGLLSLFFCHNSCMSRQPIICRLKRRQRPYHTGIGDPNRLQPTVKLVSLLDIGPRPNLEIELLWSFYKNTQLLHCYHRTSSEFGQSRLCV